MDIYSISAKIESLNIPSMGIVRKLIPVAFKVFEQMKKAKTGNLEQCEALIKQAVNDNSLTTEQEKIVRDTLAVFSTKKVNPMDAVQDLGSKVSPDKISKFMDIHLKRSIANALKGVIELSQELQHNKEQAEDEYTLNLWTESLTKLRVKQDQLFHTMRANSLPIPKTFLQPIDDSSPINTVLDYYITALKTYTKDADKGMMAYAPLALDAVHALQRKTTIEKKMKLGDKEVNINLPKLNPASFLDEDLVNNVLGILNNKDIEQVRIYRDEAFKVCQKVLETENSLSVVEGAKLKHLNALIQEADIVILINDTL